MSLNDTDQDRAAMLIQSLLLRKKLRDKVKQHGNTGSPFVPSTEEAIQGFISLAQIQSDDIVCDIGCGDGRVLLDVARITQCKGIGVEIDVEKAEISKQRFSEESSLKLRVIEQSFDCLELWENELNNVSVFYVFMLPGACGKISQYISNLVRNRKKGCRVVSHGFKMDEQILGVNCTRVHSIVKGALASYLYEIPDSL
jgi:cyclopropane fatty-acyl-phospholipid synthase-like methyltransferase